MAENQKVVQGLQHIVTAVSQGADAHTIQSRIFAAKGLSKLAEKYAEHAAEERGYAEKCIDRLLDLGCAVKVEAKEEMPIYTDALEYLKYDYQVSKDGLAWLAELVEAARQDVTTYDLLKEYYQDEEGDMYWAEQQIELAELVRKAGVRVCVYK